jgi:hypothetical protein
MAHLQTPNHHQYFSIVTQFHTSWSHSKVLQKLACERDEVRREEFRASLRNDFIGDGSEFVVIDETSKNDHTYARHYGRAPRGHRAHLSDVFVRGDRYSLCAAMTTQGYLTCHAVEGSFDAQEFYDFVAEDFK